MTRLQKKVYNYLLIFLGLCMFLIFIWFRFIRLRLPRDIPFKLSFLGMLILVLICCTYIYIIYIYIYNFIKTTKNIETNSIGSILIQFILIPLKEFDKTLKNLKIISKITQTILLFLSEKFKGKEVRVIVYLTILPRIFMTFVLVIETFYFHHLSFFYKLIFLGIFILLEKYIKYSLKTLTNSLILQNIQKVSINMPYEYAINITENPLPEDEDEEDFIPETLYVNLDKFIEYQTGYFIENQHYARYSIFSTSIGLKDWQEVNHIIGDLTRAESQNYIRTSKQIISDILLLNLFLTRLNLIENYQKIKTIKMVFIVNFLVCWSYILIVCFPYLYFDRFFYIILSTLWTVNPSNPFVF